MTIEETPSYAALVAKKAELTTSQTTGPGYRAPATITLGRELAALIKTCQQEAGMSFPD